MKLGTLLDQRFKSALAKLQTASLPLKVAFKLRHTVKAIEKELATYEETRQAALQKYGQKDAEGKLLTNDDEMKSVKFESEETFRNFLVELADLSKVDVDIPKIAAADLGDSIHLSADDIAMLEDLLQL